jgi:hypothetical protein
MEQGDPKRDDEFKLFQDKIRLEDFTDIHSMVTIEGSSDSRNKFLSEIKKVYPKIIPVITLQTFHKPLHQSSEIHNRLVGHKLFCVIFADNEDYISPNGIKRCLHNLVDFILSNEKAKYVCLLLKDPEQISSDVQKRLDLSKFIYYKLI